MFFLLRMTFWLGLVLILLPTGSSQPAAGKHRRRDRSYFGRFRDGRRFSQFCARQPDACTVGSQVATALGYKAQAGAKMLYDFLTEQMAPKETGSVASRSAICDPESRAMQPVQRLAEHAHPRRSCAGLARPGAAQGHQAFGIAPFASPRINSTSPPRRPIYRAAHWGTPARWRTSTKSSAIFRF